MTSQYFVAGADQVKSERVQMYQVAYTEWDIRKAQNWIEKLPESVLLKIFHCLSFKNLGRSAMVCQQWRRVAYDKSLWREVDCRGCTLTETSLGLINRISCHVSLMNMSGSAITVSLIAAIAVKCVNLKTLSLQGARITDYTSDFRLNSSCFENLENIDIRFLYGDNSKIFLTLLDKLKNIRCFGINSVGSSVELDRIFINLHNLRIVHCQNCAAFNDSHVTMLANYCPKLESLCLTGCIYISGSSFPRLLSDCKHLKTLLISCTRLRNTYFMLTDWTQSSLTELDISYCYGIGESGLLEMLPYLDQLRYLQVSFCGWGRALTTDVINAMATTEYKALDTLDIHSSFKVTGDALCSFFRNCPVLKTLCVGNIISSDDELEAVLKSLTSLKHFYITKQDKIKTETVFSYVGKFCPTIETLALYNFYALNGANVEEALIELVTACRLLKVLCIRGTNVALRTKLTDLADRVKTASRRNDIEISKRPHFLLSGAELCLDNVVNSPNSLK